VVDIQGVTDSLESQDDDSMLKCVIDLAENVPKYLRHQLEPVVTLCMKVGCYATWCSKCCIWVLAGM